MCSLFVLNNKYVLDKIFDANPETNHSISSHPFADKETFPAVFTHTTRGREQLIFTGQPYVYEKRNILPNGDEKRLWRCNQWWNNKCRARVFTINDRVHILNRFHTHEEIIKRKKRVAKKKVKPEEEVFYIVEKKDGEETPMEEQFVTY